MIIQNFTRNDFIKSGISDLTLNEYINNGYLLETPDCWQLKYPELYKNKPTDYYNMRLKNPTENKKYIKPKELCSRLFRPLALSPNIISNRNEYIIITEGEKKAIKAVQEGFNCLALSGVWAWKRTPKDDETEINADIIPDIVNLDLKNKTIYLCYDNDMWSKPQVKQALYHFSAYLIAEKQAIVKIIKLPEIDDKIGLDDYLIKYDENNFQELLNNAKTLDLSVIQNILSDKIDSNENFPIDIFPANIKNIIIDLHKRLDAPLEYIACVFLVTVSMLMDYRFYINANPASNFIEYPILWLALVGKPSQKKTPCLKIGKKILDNFEAILLEKYEIKLEQYKKDYIQYKAELEVYKQFIKQGKNAEIPKEPRKPLKPRITTQNATVEALCMAINSNKDIMLGIGIFTDELAHLFKSFNQYKGGGGNDKEYFLQAWCKDRQNIIRKGTDEDFIVEASHNIIGGIQPKVLDETLFKKGIESTDGMLERWLFCCTGYEETGILPDFKEKYDISVLKNCCEKIFKYKINNTPKGYKFDDNALIQFKTFFKEISDLKKSNSISNLIASYMSKQISYVARFSLVLHCIENIEKDEISINTLNNAIELSKYFIYCFHKLLNERITINPLEDYTLNLLRIKNIKTISPTELYKKNISCFRTLEMAKIALENLASKGYGRICKSGTRGYKFIFYG